MDNYTAYLPKYGNYSKDMRIAVRASLRLDDTAVVTLQAEALDHVFALLNHGSGCELPGYKGRSLSVGDLVQDPQGKFWLCDSMGWKEINFDLYMHLV